MKTNDLVRAVKSKGVKFLLIGGFVFILSQVALIVSIEVFQYNEVASNLITQVGALQVSFLLNKYYNWAESNGSFWSQWAKFHVARLIVFFINQAAFLLLFSFGIPYLPINIGLMGFETIVNFITSHVWAFRDRKPH